MSKKLFSYFAGATLVAMLVVPSFAQQIQLKANVPFDFTVSNKEMPAGEYTINTVTGSMVLTLRQEGAGATVLSLSSSMAEPGKLSSGESQLVFHRYGNQYVLAQIWDGSIGLGRSLPESRIERELAQTASTQTYAVLAVTARR
jgi:hypothetical protein